MPFQFTCTSCGQPIGVMEQMAGQITTCQTCGAQQMVPAPPGGQQYAPPGGQQYAPPGGQQYAPPGGQQYAPPGGQQYAPPGGQPFTPAPPPGGYQFNSSGFAPQGGPIMTGGGFGSRIGRGLGGLVGVIVILVILNVVSQVLGCGWVFY
jgi:uncharacterized membrane protein